MSGQAEAVSTRPAEVTPARKRRARWTIAAILGFAILAALLLPLVSLGRYHRTIADSLSRSVGHTVRLGSVNLAIFPLPGLVIHDLIVEEDPAFGAEPLLRAPQVTVFLRFSSLWNQRLEISRINLDNASVNLARDSSGRWNFASLLLEASRTTIAPTAQRRAGAAPRFPYIQFSSARINFKEGAEKKAFSFLNADASVWLADPGQWHIRFAAQPARTDLDLDLADTGTIRLEGSLTRAASLEELPLNLHAEWTGAQLGQVTRLVFGSDSGWRGDLSVQAGITGDIDNLALSTRLRVANAHRIEFTPLNPVNIYARCQASYYHPAQLFDNLTCLWPTGDGHLLLTGSIQDLSNPQPRLNLEINHTPAAFATNILGLLRSSISSTLTATGTINGQFNWAPENAPVKLSPAQPPAPHNILTGHATAENVGIHLAGADQPITFAALRFITPREEQPPCGERQQLGCPILDGREAHGKGGFPRKSGKNRGLNKRDVRAQERWVPQVSTLRPGSDANILALEPANFNAGAPTPMQVSAQFTRSGFALHFTGESSLARLQPVARNFSQIHALATLADAKGTAQSDLTFTGPWLPSIDVETGVNTPAAIQGWTRLQHAVLKPAWLHEPLEIISATAQFGSDSTTRNPITTRNSITWTNAAITINGIAAKGSATYPATCADPAGCPAEVTLDFPTLSAAALQAALTGTGHSEFLQAILSTVESPAPWPALNATIHAAALTIGNLKLNNARAAIAIRDNRVNILSLDAATLGGSAHLTGSIEPTSDGPQYALNITTTGTKLLEAASLFHEDWGAGTLDGQMQLNLHGYSNLAASATGDFRFLLHGSWGGNWTTTEPAAEPSPVLLNTAQSASETPVSESSLAETVPSEATGQTSAHNPKSARNITWTAAGTIADQTLTFTNGPATGTIAFDRTLNLDWTRNHPAPTEPPAETAPLTEAPAEPPAETAPLTEAPAATANAAFHITGTLSQPRTQAAPTPTIPSNRPRNPRNN